MLKLKFENLLRHRVKKKFFVTRVITVSELNNKLSNLKS